jgi:hypothetical protein
LYAYPKITYPSSILQLLNLWESKNNYFDASVVEKLKNPSRSWSEYQAALITQHAAVITPITASTKQTYDGYQAQHQAFVQHAMQQIQTLEQQKQQLEQQQQTVGTVAVNPAAPGSYKTPSDLLCNIAEIALVISCFWPNVRKGFDFSYVFFQHCKHPFSLSLSLSLCCGGGGVSAME